MVAVPLYDTLGTEAIAYIIDKGTEEKTYQQSHIQCSSALNYWHRLWFMVSAAITTVICDLPDKARLILSCVGSLGKTVKTIILMEPFDGDLVKHGQECGVEILSLKDFEVRKKTYGSHCLILVRPKSISNCCIWDIIHNTVVLH